MHSEHSGLDTAAPIATRNRLLQKSRPKRGNVRLIVATAHADRSGPIDYNRRLSERRAASVRAALVREGIAASTTRTSGRGENDNLVATPDGVREPRNRRVEIAFR